MFDAVQEAPQDDMAVVIEGNRIVDIIDADELEEKYPQAAVDHYPNATLLPGLVNAHSHLTMPGDGSTVEQAMARSDDELLLIAHRNAERALAAGVTTLADLGGRDFLTFRLREASASGAVVAPRLRLAGYPITTKMGHCWPMHYGVEGIDQVRSVARRLLERGADIIKVMVTGGSTVGSDSFSVALPSEVLAAAAEEAKKAAVPSFAHVQTIEAIRLAVQAGFDVIVHGTFFDSEGQLGFDQETAEMALEAGVTWNPTLNVNWSNYRRLEADEDVPSDHLEMKLGQYQRHDEYLRRVYELGVPIAAGSDEGWSSNTFGTFVEELEALENAGVKPLDVVRSATAGAAAALGVNDSVGTLETGKLADIIVAEGNIAEGPGVLRTVNAVFLGGSRVAEKGKLTT
jgi:imidazolonepropionase-like amidohydrolase